MSAPNPFPDFDRRMVTLFNEATGQDETREVFVKGSGPAVVVMHEVPGLYPTVADFGRRVADLGLTVYMPSLVGRPGKEFSPAYALASIARACVMREFTTFARGKNSPVTGWLRALAREAHAECGGPGVGAIGMCLTGGFALAMMADPILIAPVLSQPSLPFALSRAHARDLGIDEATLTQVKARADEGVCVMGLRFTSDRLSPEARFKTLKRELGDAFLPIRIPSPDPALDIPRDAHSVVTRHLRDTPGHPTRLALDEVLAFFSERLLVAQAEAS